MVNETSVFKLLRFDCSVCPLLTYNMVKQSNYHTKLALTHFRLNKTNPHYLLEELNFNFRYVMLCDFDIPREKWLSYCKRKDLVQTLHNMASRGLSARL